LVGGGGQLHRKLSDDNPIPRGNFLGRQHGRIKNVMISANIFTI